MGLFDNIGGLPEVECPRCGTPLRDDWQTKDLNCSLTTYYVGKDYVGNRMRFIYCHNYCTECRMPKPDGRPRYWCCAKIQVSPKGRLMKRGINFIWERLESDGTMLDSDDESFLLDAVEGKSE